MKNYGVENSTYRKKENVLDAPPPLTKLIRLHIHVVYITHIIYRMECLVKVGKAVKMKKKTLIIQKGHNSLILYKPVAKYPITMACIW